MNETELSRLVVRLVGDSTSYQRMLAQATAQTQAFAAAAVSALGSVGVAVGLTSAFRAAGAFEESMIRLSYAVKSNSGDVDATVKSHKEFAATIARNTMFTRAETLALLERAEAIGVTGKEAEQMVAQAMGLATAGHIPVQTALRIQEAMKLGNFEMLRFVQSLRAIKDPAERTARAQKLTAIGLQEMQEIANTATNRLTLLSRGFMELTLDVGKMVAEAIRPAVEQGQRFLDWFRALDPASKALAARIVLVVGAVALIPQALRLVRSLLSPVIALFSLLGRAVVTAASAAAAAAWAVAWTAAVATVTAATLALKGAVLALGVAWNVVSLVGAGLRAAGTLVAAAASAAAAAAAALPAVLLNLLVFVPLVVAGVILFTSAVKAGWEGLRVLAGGVADAFGALREGLAVLAGALPLRQLQAAFGDLYDAVLLVVRAVKVDMGLAWELVKVGAALAVEYVKDLWPPLWAVVREGAVRTGTFLLDFFTNKFDVAWDRMRTKFVYNLAEMTKNATSWANDVAETVAERIPGTDASLRRNMKQLREAQAEEIAKAKAEAEVQTKADRAAEAGAPLTPEQRGRLLQEAMLRLNQQAVLKKLKEGIGEGAAPAVKDEGPRIINAWLDGMRGAFAGANLGPAAAEAGARTRALLAEGLGAVDVAGVVRGALGFGGTAGGLLAGVLGAEGPAAENPAVRALQDQLKGLADDLGKAEALRAAGKKQEDIAKLLGTATGAAYSKKVKEHMKFDAAEYFSAEAITRAQQFADLVAAAGEKGAHGAAGGHAAAPGQAAEAGGAEGVAREQGQQNGLLDRIALATEKMAGKDPLTVAPAGIA